MFQPILTIPLIHVCKVFSFKIKDKPVKLVQELDERIPDNILIDSIRLEQILHHLIRLSLAGTDKGYVKITSRLTNQSDSTHSIDVCISIEDTGSTTASSRMADFRSADEKEQLDIKDYRIGSRCELSICKHLIKLMGGHLKVEPIEDSGLKLEFILTNLEVDLKTGSTKSFTPSSHEFVKFNQQSVLIASDSDLTGYMLEQVSSEINLSPCLVRSEDKIISKANEIKPAAIILDSHLIQNRIKQAMDMMNSNSITKSIPLVLLVDSLEDLVSNPITPDKLCSVLIKPVDTQTLMVELQRLMNPDIEYQTENLNLTDK
jgi:hypothetical protein